MVSYRHCVISFAVAILLASCEQKPALSVRVELVDWPANLRISDAELCVIIADEFPMGDAPRDFRVPPEKFGKSEKIDAAWRQYERATNEMPALWNAPEYRKEPYKTFTTTADAKGRYTIPELPEGTAYVSVAYHLNGSRLDTFRSIPRKVQIKPGRPVELAIYLTPADWFDL